MAEYVRTEGIGRNAVTVSQLSPEELEAYRQKYPPRPDKKKKRQAAFSNIHNYGDRAKKKEEPTVAAIPETAKPEQKVKQLDKETYFRMKKEGLKDSEIRKSFQLSNVKFFAWKDENLTEEERQQTRQKKGAKPSGTEKTKQEAVLREKNVSSDPTVAKLDHKEAETPKLVVDRQQASMAEALQAVKELKDDKFWLTSENDRLKDENMELRERAIVAEKDFKNLQSHYEQLEKDYKELQAASVPVNTHDPDLAEENKDLRELVKDLQRELHEMEKDVITDTGHETRLLEELSLWKGLVLLRERH